MNPREDRELQVAYLLGRISQEEREAVGDRLFADPAFAELMEESERDVLDQYARGALSAEDRAAVETYLLASDQQKAKLRFAALMAGKVVQRRSSWIGPLAAIAAVLVIAVAAWMLRPVEHTTQQEKTATTASVEPPAIFAALLSAGGTRDGSPQQVHLPAAKGQLRFDLELDPAAKAANYPVQLLHGSQVIWSQQDVLSVQEAGQPILSLRVPAAALAAGSYQFVIQWKNGESIYRFLIL